MFLQEIEREYIHVASDNFYSKADKIYNCTYGKLIRQKNESDLLLHLFLIIRIISILSCLRIIIFIIKNRLYRSSKYMLCLYITVSELITSIIFTLDFFHRSVYGVDFTEISIGSCVIFEAIRLIIQNVSMLSICANAAIKSLSTPKKTATIDGKFWKLIIWLSIAFWIISIASISPQILKLTIMVDDCGDMKCLQVWQSKDWKYRYFFTIYIVESFVFGTLSTFFYFKSILNSYSLVKQCRDDLYKIKDVEIALGRSSVSVNWTREEITPTTCCITGCWCCCCCPANICDNNLNLSNHGHQDNDISAQEVELIKNIKVVKSSINYTLVQLFITFAHYVTIVHDQYNWLGLFGSNIYVRYLLIALNMLSCIYSMISFCCQNKKFRDEIFAFKYTFSWLLKEEVQVHPQDI